MKIPFDEWQRKEYGRTLNDPMVTCYKAMEYMLYESEDPEDIQLGCLVMTDCIIAAGRLASQYVQNDIVFSKDDDGWLLDTKFQIFLILMTACYFDFKIKVPIESVAKLLTFLAENYSDIAQSIPLPNILRFLQLIGSYPKVWRKVRPKALNLLEVICSYYKIDYPSQQASEVYFETIERVMKHG